MQPVAERGESECSDEARLRSTPKLRTQTARNHSAMSFGSVDAQLQAELKGERWTVCTLTTECSYTEVSWVAWSLSRVPGRPDPELDDHRVRAHEVKVSVA